MIRGPKSSALAVLAISMLGATVTLVGIRLIGNATSDGAFAPLYGPGYDELQPVAEKVVKPGDTIHISPTKCSHELVDVIIQSYWRRVQPTVLRIAGTIGSITRPVGCETSTFALVVPADLPPGTWERTGEETAFSGSKEQRIIWATQRFEIVAPSAGQ